MKKYWAIAKVNFKKATWIAYIVSGICVLAMIVDLIVDNCLSNVGNTTISAYNMLYLVGILAPIFIASVNYSKFMNLGVKKIDYFYGCLINYLVFAFAISIVSVIDYYIIEKIIKSSSTLYGLIDVFNWDTNVLTAIFSQFFFILMVEVFIHTLVFSQAKWYGWVADLVIVILLSVFIPVPVLRNVYTFFFGLTIFAQPLIQILSCLVVSTLIYLINLPMLKNRT